jgi:hypothetical protein
LFRGYFLRRFLRSDSHSPQLSTLIIYSAARRRALLINPRKLQPLSRLSDIETNLELAGLLIVTRQQAFLRAAGFATTRERKKKKKTIGTRKE